MRELRLAIAGVGNCASALLQGREYYRRHDVDDSAGLLHPDLGGYGVEDVHPVAAFDVDPRKGGSALEEAVFAAPNCATVFHDKLPAGGVEGQRGPCLDGVAIDAIRCAKLALDRGIGGPLLGVSAFTMKHPPRQLRDSEAREELEAFILGAP